MGLERMGMRQMLLSAATILFVVGISVGAMGCQPADKASHSPLPTAAEVAANNQKSIESIQNNPNIPPATKARIIAQLQGKFKPSGKPQAPTK